MSVSPSERTSAADGEQSEGNPLGLRSGQYVQEIGYDEDVDAALRDGIAAATGEEMADEDVDDVFDVIVMWWRSDDDDLTDGIVDAQTTLADGGIVWLLTPKAGRAGHITPVDIADAAPTAGMHVTNTVTVGSDWSATRLVGKKNYG
ncbi:DUF3052 family protein [Brevibacterium sp. 5221]|uniref:DUF3052 family protein n=1 Tax=Brevibacterium rongguiense TaxID=2695267 RepID=A0A6N9H594_9MICO|nr:MULTISPECIES: DUF3052 domain-containing protein [Brevibacterium]MYM19011.1 DUF3052 family protein [Brevibacterium rongguiense]WAL40700.1 DUF3052 domain-containing protein [Brevibacterium sp. BRM-1]